MALMSAIFNPSLHVEAHLQRLCLQVSVITNAASITAASASYLFSERQNAPNGIRRSVACCATLQLQLLKHHFQHHGSLLMQHHIHGPLSLGMVTNSKCAADFSSKNTRSQERKPQQHCMQCVLCTKQYHGMRQTYSSITRRLSTQQCVDGQHQSQCRTLFLK